MAEREGRRRIQIFRPAASRHRRPSAAARRRPARPAASGRKAAVSVRAAMELKPPPYALDALEPHMSKPTLEGAPAA